MDRHNTILLCLRSVSCYVVYVRLCLPLSGSLFVILYHLGCTLTFLPSLRCVVYPFCPQLRHLVITEQQTISGQPLKARAGTPLMFLNGGAPHPVGKVMDYTVHKDLHQNSSTCISGCCDWWVLAEINQVYGPTEICVKFTLSKLQMKHQINPAGKSCLFLFGQLGSSAGK